MKCPFNSPEETQPAASAASNSSAASSGDHPTGSPVDPGAPGGSPTHRPSWGGRDWRLRPGGPFSSGRPPWWPENEVWPPVPQHGSRLRRRFFRRIGCLFLFGSLLLGAFFSLGVYALARLLGWIQVSTGQPGVFPLAVLLILVGFVFLAWIGRRLRWVSAPFGDLVEASDRVAAGDYTARVNEQGPAEVRSLVKAFNQMTGRLHDTDEQRRRMLADISHELRTPLTVVQGNLEGMLDGVYPADEQHLRSIFEETQVLSRLVEDLHLLALAESSALPLLREPTDLATLINESAAAFRPQAEAAGVSLLVEAPGPGGAPLLEVDRLRLHQVLANLISNALRYTPSGGTVQVEYRFNQGDEKPMAQIAVNDTGPGIAEQDLPYIFERSYKGRDSSGSGLGLAIARRLIEAHGGTIQAFSTPGNGTAIRIDLPA